MTINKKVINDFARMIRSQHYQIKNQFGNGRFVSDEQFLAGAEKQLSIIVDELVTIFQNDNPKFDADKFYSACEIEKE